MKLLKTLFVLGLSVTALSAPAQTVEDSLEVVTAPWKVLIDNSGIVCKKLKTEGLFGNPQKVSYIEIDPSLYYPALAQDSLIEKTSDLGIKKHGVVAINGGFFKTKTATAEAADFIKIDGKYPRQNTSHGGGAAIGIDSVGMLHFNRWAYNSEKSEEWAKRHVSVLVTGPYLVDNGKSQIPWNPEEGKHPRSCIGLKDDGTIVLLVVDGRQSEASGMGLGELAFLAKTLGLKQAINLDGGGSSTLWTKVRNLVNAPSDRILIFRSERPVANAIVIKSR